MHVQDLPESDSVKPLGEHAADLGMRPRAYHRARECLMACGYLHEWKWQSQRGHWTTEQLLSNVTLTREEANALRDGTPTDPPTDPPVAPPADSPSDRRPTSGFRDPRNPATQPVEKDGEKTFPHPPPKAPPELPEPEPAPEPAPEPGTEPDPDRAAEVVVAERVLLSLRHQSRDLLLGVREARGLAEAAAEWLRRGVSVGDLRHALTAHLPRGGVRSAVGFLRHRLTEKLPAEAAHQAPQSPQVWPDLPAPAASSPARPAELVTCDGPGNTHVFRPAGDETFCGPCRTEEAWKAHERRFQPRPDKGAPIPWRERVDAILQAEPS
ncbi:hypothetical protein [Streptomyces exfoliatus]|uniref:hypothetical protein n=1 Tax=Streptomyces exfoliatus TaxID=1905 RepID=UPI003C3081DE